MRLFHGALDTLVFAEETLTFARSGHPGPPQSIVMGPGHVESQLRARAEAGDATAKVFRLLLSRCRAYQFHDTSSTAAPRRFCYVGDDRWLMPDGGNVAAILRRLREQGRPEFGRIVGAIRQIVPLFGEFVLEPSGPNGTDLALNWRERDSDHVFGPHQFSDGTLRAICLATLLLQPVEDLPDLVVVDEPELGLHPAAQVLLAGLLRKVSHHRQVLVATQSVTLVDEFDPQDVVVVDREDRESVFRRLDAANLESWLEDYSLGEIWEKNVVGGGPFR
jgi:predicted ATPase